MKFTFLHLLTLLLVLALMVSMTACNRQPEETDPSTQQPTEEEYVPVLDPVDDNYRTFYQIFVGSFSDSNNDGIGDLRGVINRFDYLNDGDMNSETSLGVQGIWLSPIFSSPSYHKYDASNYYEIDWRFGTESDLKELIELCHSRNVKIILDLAINHTAIRGLRPSRRHGRTETPVTPITITIPVSPRQKKSAASSIRRSPVWTAPTSVTSLQICPS